MSICCKSLLPCTRSSSLHIQYWARYYDETSKREPVTVQVYIRSMKEHSTEDFKELLDRFSTLFFDVMDSNNNGYIEKGDFRLFFSIVGLDAAAADEAFKVIDTNGDGRLSREEFKTAYLDFWTSEDETSPNRFFFGPLD
jgi:Ca2+-binding EF-hand superfamily protein